MLIILGAWIATCAGVGIYGLYVNDMLEDELNNIKDNIKSLY
tara:strand:+ start:983 stop:1108 length:126 start_codon:yes stop_codon:yes gene_type:complete